MVEREKSNFPISREQQRIGDLMVFSAALDGGNIPLAREAVARLGFNPDVIFNPNHPSEEIPEDSTDSCANSEVQQEIDCLLIVHSLKIGNTVLAKAVAARLIRNLKDTRPEQSLEEIPENSISDQ